LKKLISSLFLILLVAVLTFLAGLGLILYFQQHQLTNPIIERSLIILVTGLVAGFATRIILRKWHIFWRILIPFIAVGLGIILFDKIFPKNYELLFYNARTPWSEPVVIDLVQIGLGYVMGLLALFIGMRRKSKQTTVRSQPRPKTKTRSKPAAQSAQKPILFKTKRVDHKKKISKKITKKPILLRSLPVPKTTRLISTKLRRLRRKDVKLLGETEHRCPYCLELVKKNDARGVVICPDCKTWHHKDCWDVTGSCQVAHRHDL
jgi:ribosomal protein L37AE/L43A